MADEQRLIYKVELDDSGYIRATESMTASTKRLSDSQEQANKTLQANQTALKSVSEYVVRSKNDLDSYTGTNERYRQQLLKAYNDAVKQQTDLMALVAKNQAAYENATKAAQDFADTSAKAGNLQQQAGGGKIAPVSVAPIAPVVAPVNLGNLGGLPQAVGQTTNEFTALAEAIQLAEQRMNELDSTSDEFKRLEPIVSKGKEALQAYSIVATFAGDSHERLRTQILQGRDALARLEQENLQTSQTYVDLQKHVAQLTQEYRIAEQEINVLSSQTRALDFGKAAVQTAVSSFQALTSVELLFGDANAETQKKVIQLFAAMQLLSSLEQLTNEIKKGSIIQTNLQSVALATYNAVVGASTGALKAFRLALLGTGIGAAVVAIGFLVSAYSDLADSLKRDAALEKAVGDARKAAADDAGKEVAEIKTLYSITQDVTQSVENRKIATEELVKINAENNIRTGEQTKLLIDQNGILEKNDIAIQNLTDSLFKQALTKAFLSEIEKAFSKLIEAQTASLNSQTTAAGDFIQFVIGGFDQIAKHQLDAKDKSIKNAQDLVTSLRNIFEQGLKTGQFDLSGIFGDKKKLQDFSNEAEKILADINKEKFDALKASLQAEIDNDNAIIADEQRAFNDRFAATQDFYDKSLLLIKSTAEFERKQAILTTQEQRKQLQDRLEDPKLVPKQRAEINSAISLLSKKLADDEQAIEANKNREISKLNITSEKQRTDLFKQRTAAIKKVEDEIFALEEKASVDSVNLIADEFEKRAAFIELNEKKELDELKKNQEDRLKALDLSRALIGDEEYYRARQAIVTTGEQETNNIIAKFAQERIDLSAEVFKKSLDNYTRAIQGGDLVRDQALAKQIGQQADRFLQGRISFEKFQREIEHIQQRSDAQRRLGEIQVLQDELSDLDRHLAAIKDTNSKEYDDTKQTRDKLADDIAKKQAEDKIKQAQDKHTDAEEKANDVTKYAEAVGKFSQSIIEFWQTANEAEQRALDRSIAIQQTRVDQAQKIAERGNAQYLASETDRLKQLQVARENAARRQLGIDAALQASQILVGITGAIAKISTGIGVAETIAEIAVIVGALATGYGLVRSLQTNQPHFKEGTPYLQRGEHRPGTDTIPAMLTEGEAVIPRERNEQYHPTVKAIYDQKIPAKVINEFVKNYTKKNVVSNVINETSDKKIEDHIVNEVVNNKAKTVSEKIIDVVSKFSKQDKTEISKLLSSIKTDKIVSTLIKNKIVSKEDKKSVSEQLNAVVSSAKDYRFVEVVNRLVNKTIDDQTKNRFVNEFGLKKYSQVVDSVRTNDIIVNKIINRRLNNISRDVNEAIMNIASDSIDRKIDESIVNDVVNKKTIADFVSTHSRHDKARIEKILSDKSINIVDNLIKNKVVDASDASKIRDISDFQHAQRVFNTLNKTSEIIDRVVSEHTYIPTATPINAPLPPAYQRIKEAAEMKITHDGNLAISLSEQNKLIEENNELQRQTLRAMKMMSVSARIDKEGVAIMVNEYMQQLVKDKKL